MVMGEHTPRAGCRVWETTPATPSLLVGTLLEHCGVAPKPCRHGVHGRVQDLLVVKLIKKDAQRDAF